MPRTCPACGKSLEGRHPATKFCNPTCKKRRQRNPSIIQASPAEPAPPFAEHPLVAQARAELTTAGVIETTAGQVALALATGIASSHETLTAKASASKQLREAMADALAASKPAADPLDELRLLRDRKRAG